MKKTLSLLTSVRFSARNAALVAAAAWAMICGAVQAQVALYGTINTAPANGGLGSVLQYTPAGKQSTFVMTLSRPRGMAFDSSGNLYVATTTFSNTSLVFVSTIVLITPGGGQTTLGGADPNFVIEGLATDSNGNVFAAAQASDDSSTTIYEFTPAGGRTTFGSVPGQAFGLAFDSAGNLYAADTTVQSIYKFTPNGTSSVFIASSAFSSTQFPIGLAFDRSDNLYVSTTDAGGSNLPGDAIVKFTPNGTESTFASGLTTPRGITFDSAGNLYVAEIPDDLPTGDILQFNSKGKKSVFASGLGDGPNGGVEFVIAPSQRGNGPR